MQSYASLQHCWHAVNTADPAGLANWYIAHKVTYEKMQVVYSTAEPPPATVKPHKAALLEALCAHMCADLLINTCCCYLPCVRTPHP